MQWFGRLVEKASGMSRVRLLSGHFGSSAAFFLFLQLFDVCVIGSIVLDLTCASVFKNFAMARRVKEVFGTYEEMKCRGIELNTVTNNMLPDACRRARLRVARHG